MTFAKRLLLSPFTTISYQQKLLSTISSPFSTFAQLKMSKLLQVDSLGNLKDRQGRTVALRGINLDASSKMPSQIPTTFLNPGNDFWDGDNVSFIDRPFTLKEAPVHLERLKSWGFNTIRYIFTWEALEHKGP